MLLIASAYLIQCAHSASVPAISTLSNKQYCAVGNINEQHQWHW